MPLMHGKSKEAFSKNVKTEMHAGKPLPQSLAIAYSMKKRKKMAQGGQVGKPMDDVPEPNPQKAKEMQQGATEGDWNPSQWGKNLKSGLGMAEGGQIKDNYQPSYMARTRPDMADHEMDKGYVDHEGNDVKADPMAMEEDDRDLNQHGEYEQGPYGTMMAEGGQITDNYQSDSDMLDMVGRIMKQREEHFSEGGKVANGGEDDLNKMADGRPNNFDDLSLRDDLTSSNSGTNDGDFLGNSQEDEDRADIVARIMRSRMKKDRNPVPA